MKKKTLVAIAAILTIIAVWVTFTHLDGFSQLQQLVKASGIWGAAIFVIAYAIATLLILPVTALNIAGGALYGGFEGLLLTSTGALTSALMGFILARWLGNKWLPNDKSELNISKNLVSGGIGYAFAARLFPLIPYGIVSFVAGLSPIKYRDYLIGTLLGTPLGIAPFVFLCSTGVQVTTSHDVRPLLVSSLGLSILVVVGTWYSSNRKEELVQESYADAKK